MSSDTPQQVQESTHKARLQLAESFAFDAGEKVGVAFGLVPAVVMITFSWFNGVAPWWIGMMAIMCFFVVLYDAARVSRFASAASQSKSKWMRRKAIALLVAIMIIDGVRRSFA